MNKQEFQQLIQDDFPIVTHDFFNQVELYKKIIIVNNETINLTSLASEEKIYGDYFYDSLIVYKNIDFDKYKSVLDIGSGSGIPGALLKLLFPQIKLTIIESNIKKCNFMKLLVKELNLDNIVILNKRAEEIDVNDYEKFDIVTSRAVAPLKIIMELSVPYCKVGGLIIQPKSKNFINERKDFSKLLPSLNISLVSLDNFVSKNNHEHHVFIYKKNKVTNRRFPRK
jgi:16S rRNA (guanine527-N7)-methyltransferase